MSTFLSFVATFCVLFAMTIGFLAVVDALPNSATGESAASEDVPPASTLPAGQAELPVRIAQKNIDLDVVVANPTDTDVEVLDQALLKGAVRYPTSGMLGENGTVLIFGHSSYLPIVHNQNYKAFDGIQTLKPGEIISVYSGTREYRYAVVGVRVANAKEDVVELPSDKQYLTLITCDSFATKSDRYVVTATLAN